MLGLNLKSLVSSLVSVSLASVAALSAPAQALDKVKICLPALKEDVLSLVLLVAQDQGFFERHDIEETFLFLKAENSSTHVKKEGQSKKANAPQVDKQSTLPPDISQKLRILVADNGVTDQVAKGKCDFGLTNLDHQLFQGFESAGSKTVPLIVTAFGRDFDSHLVHYANSEIKNIADLKGKKIRGDTLPTLLALAEVLKESGISSQDYKVHFENESQKNLNSLAQQAIQASVTNPVSLPYWLASGRIEVVKSQIVKDYLLPSIPYYFLIANYETFRKNQNLMERFTKSVEQALAFINKEPSQVLLSLERHGAKLGLKNFKIDRVQLEKALPFTGQISLLNLITSEASVLQRVIGEVRSYEKKLTDFGLTSQSGLKTGANAAMETWIRSSQIKK